MAAVNERESILVIGASGRTGTLVLRYLCAAAVPVIACVRRVDRVPAELQAAAVDVATADLEQPGTIAPLLERAAHVIWLGGSARRTLSPGAWQVEVESLRTCLELTRRSGFDGRFIYVGYSGSESRDGTTWAESRWRELKVEAEQVITASNVNYFVLRTGHITDSVAREPNVSVTQHGGVAPDAQLPSNVLAFLLTGAALAGAAYRSKVTVRLHSGGAKLQDAVQAFSRLRSEDTATAGAHGLFGGA